MAAHEKRKEPRIDTENLLSYVCLDESDRELKQGMGRTLNISEGGILMETHVPMEPHYSVSLTISMEEDMMVIKGNISYCSERADGRFETGIQFIETDEAQREFLRQYIEIFKGRNSGE